MLIAVDRRGEYVSASRAVHAFCDPWAATENAWTERWKTIVGPDRRDVWIRGHRADMLADGGQAVVLRHSSTTGEEIEERERHFGEVIWIFDAHEAAESGRLDLRAPNGEHDSYRTFRWKHARVSLALAHQRVYLDLGQDEILHLRKIYPNAPVGGWGHLRPRDVVTRFLAGRSSAEPHPGVPF
jgi:hypothetical protein